MARGPVTLTCAGEAAPSGECLVADVPADGFEITLALAESAKADRGPESPGADVYDEAGGRTQVGLLVGVGAPDSVPFTGRYHGTASLGGGAGLADSGDARDLRARVTAEVFEDVVVLHDPEQLVLPVDPLVLRATVAEDATVDLPQMVWFAAEAGATEGAEIWSPATSAASPTGAGLLDLSFGLALQGLSAGAGAAPTLTLRVALTREADLEEGGEAPELTPGAMPLLAADRGDARFASGIAFEAAALAAIAADPAIRAIALRGESTSVVGCVADVQRLRAETLPGVCEANRPAEVLPTDCEAAALGLNAAGPAAIPCAWDIDVTFDPPECMADSGACIAACPGGEASDGCRSFCRELCRYQGDAQPRSVCAVVQAVIGCEVEARAGEWVRNPVASSGTRLTGACVLPPVPERDRAACAVVGLCARDTDLAAEAVAGAGVSARSGDVLCATAEGDTPSEAFPALESEPTDLDALVSACLDDLARAPANTFEATAGCLGLARALTAFELAAPLTGDDAGAGAMAHRTIQAVVQVQALVPTLALDLHREKLMLAEDPRTEDTLAALDASIALWGVVLDPRVIGVLRGLPDAVLANPDPRPHLGLVVSVDAPSGPTRGIAIALLDAAAAQLELIDFLLERAWFEGENARMRDRQSRAAALLRKVQLVAAVAEEPQIRAAQGRRAGRADRTGTRRVSDTCSASGARCTAWSTSRPVATPWASRRWTFRCTTAAIRWARTSGSRPSRVTSRARDRGRARHRADRGDRGRHGARRGPTPVARADRPRAQRGPAHRGHRAALRRAHHGLLRRPDRRPGLRRRLLQRARPAPRHGDLFRRAGLPAPARGFPRDTERRGRGWGAVHRHASAERIRGDDGHAAGARGETCSTPSRQRSPRRRSGPARSR